MAVTLITYTDKVTIVANPNPDGQQCKSGDANEVKDAINDNAAILVTANQIQLAGAYSDETSDLEVGVVWSKRVALAFELKDWIFDVAVAPVGSVITLDVKLNGATIFSTLPTIAAAAFISTGAILSTTTIPVAGLLTVHITTVGSSTAGAGLKGDPIGELI